jgi:hypothetical protein
MVGDERNADDPERDRGLAAADVDECCFARDLADAWGYQYL